MDFNKAEIKMPTPQPATAENAWINTIDGDRPEIIALARQIIAEQIYGTLATSSPDGMPWGTPLFFVYDAALNFYWSSAIAAQHSQHLYRNQGRAMITIYDATKIKAVYFAGVATELTEPTKLAQILKLFDQRAKRPNPRLAADYLDSSPRRMYQFAINAGWVTGDRLQLEDQLIDTKIQLNLAAL